MEAETTPVHLRPLQRDHSSDDVGPSRKKQKRNKPTLSCEECVERKTKVNAALNLAAWRQSPPITR
jgi:hypothetical protein